MARIRTRFVCPGNENKNVLIIMEMMMQHIYLCEMNEREHEHEPERKLESQRAHVVRQLRVNVLACASDAQFRQ